MLSVAGFDMYRWFDSRRKAGPYAIGANGAGEGLVLQSRRHTFHCVPSLLLRN